MKPTDYHAQKSFAETLLGKIDSNRFDLKNLIMSDEVHFCLTGAVNKQNCRNWAPPGDSPHIIHKKPLQDPHVTVWAGVAAWCIVGPFFFNNNINTEWYVNMNETFICPLFVLNVNYV